MFKEKKEKRDLEKSQIVIFNKIIDSNTQNKKKHLVYINNFYLLDTMIKKSKDTKIPKLLRSDSISQNNKKIKDLNHIAAIDPNAKKTFQHIIDNNFEPSEFLESLNICGKTTSFTKVKRLLPHEINYITCWKCQKLFINMFTIIRTKAINDNITISKVSDFTAVKIFLRDCGYTILDYNEETKLFALSNNPIKLDNKKEKKLNSSPVYADITGRIFLAEDDFIYIMSKKNIKHYNYNLISSNDAWVKSKEDLISL